MCLGLVDCVTLDDKTCQDCYSGSRECPGKPIKPIIILFFKKQKPTFFVDLQCWVPGSCVGHTISAENVSNEDECLTLCKSEASCQWITFNEIDGACILLTECSALGVSDCNTCWSSQVQCGEREGMV